MIFLLLFWEFFKTGLFSIGGGLATLPFLSRMGEQFGWFTQDELANMLAVSESTPGPIGVNMATYVGNSVGGVLGGFCATVGLVLPSFLIVLAVAKVMHRFQNHPVVQASMKTLRPASVGMVFAAVAGVIWAALFREDGWKTGHFEQLFIWPNLLLFGVLLAFYLKFPKLHPIVILGIGAAVGILLKL